MEGGGRGGGRGNAKGKKAKARSKKAAAAASTAVGHKKGSNTVHHGGKKIGSNYSNVQVVSALAAGSSSANAAKGDAATASAVSQQQPKQKRKKTKAKTTATVAAASKNQAGKQTAVAAEKKAVKPKTKKLAAQRAEKEATQAHDGHSVVSLKAATKPAKAVGTAKSQIVSLTGSKKKKKKAVAMTTEDAAADDTSLPSSSSSSSSSSSTTTTTIASAAGHSVKKKQAAMAPQSTKKGAGATAPPVPSPSAPTTIKSLKLAAAKLKRKIEETDSSEVKSEQMEPLKKTARETAVTAPASPKAASKRVSPKSAMKPTSSGSSTVSTPSIGGKKAVVVKSAPVVSSTEAAQEVVATPQTPVPANLTSTAAVSKKAASPSASMKRPRLATKGIADPSQPPAKRATRSRDSSAVSPRMMRVRASSSRSPSPPAKTVAPRMVKMRAATTPTGKSRHAGQVSKPQAQVHTVSSPVTKASKQPAKGEALLSPMKLPARESTEVCRAPTQPDVQSAEATSSASTTSTKPVMPVKTSTSVEVVTPVKTAAPMKEESPVKRTASMATPHAAPLSVTPGPMPTIKAEDASGHSDLPTQDSQQVAPKPLSKDTKSIEEAVPTQKVPVPASVTRPKPKLKPSQQTSSETNAAVKSQVAPAMPSDAVSGVDFAHTEEKASEDVATDPSPVASTGHKDIEKLGIIMDSHNYVEKMMRGDLEQQVDGSAENQQTQASSKGLAPPRRPGNTWGATFGLGGVDTTRDASFSSRALMTSPLSSWFLSKGSANFVKRVHFSEDEGEDEDEATAPDASGNVNAISARHTSSPEKKRKRRVGKNAFLQSLVAQSSWRSWYGNVDMDELLDPPLTNVADPLRTHEVAPLPLPESGDDAEIDNHGKGKRDALELLEAEIRREKQRGSAFGEQLLLMLQGASASGKSFEEEYRPFLLQ